MRPPPPTAAPRRALATRNARWAAALAAWLGRVGVRPNAVSIAGVVFAIVAAVAFARTAEVGPNVRVALLLVSACGIQLRLLCNLLDGMLAVEGGFKTKTGDLYNDLPDRIADVVIFVGAGYAVEALPLGLTLGWSAAVLAIFTAYVRVLGGALRLEQHFIGPMAKQHRMFTLTLASLVGAGEAVSGMPPRAIYGGLGTHRGGIGRDGRPAYPPAGPGARSAMIGPALATACRLITGAVVHWHCDPHADVQRVYFGNHSSHLDFVVIWAALPPRLRRLTRPVAGSDYWTRGRVRRYLANEVFHAVLIERAHAGEALTPATTRASFQCLLDGLGDRHSLIVFPEGTRSASGEIGPFKSGLFHLSRARPDTEIVPVYLENLNRILPKGEALPVPMLSRVVFGPPVGLLADEDKAAFLTRARQALLRLRQPA